MQCKSNLFNKYVKPSHPYFQMLLEAGADPNVETPGAAQPALLSPRAAAAPAAPGYIPPTAGNLYELNYNTPLGL